MVAGLLALDGAIFAAWLAWAAVQQQIQSSERAMQQQIQSSERDRDLQQLETKDERRIALQSEISELQAMLEWAKIALRRLNKTPYGPGGVVKITPAETRRQVIFSDNIGEFALRTNMMQVGAAFNACLASFHQLADNFRKPDLSDAELKELYTASIGNLNRLQIWLDKTQVLIKEKQGLVETITEQIASLKRKVGKQ
jgi:hypothetical protein